jgi:effector-binding domain-containing protein
MTLLAHDRRVNAGSMSRDVELRTLPPQPVAVVRADVALEDLPAFLGGAFEEVATTLGRQGLAPAGPPFGRYLPRSDGSFEVEAGFPVERPVTGTGRVKPAELPGGTVATTLYQGPYDGVSEAYATATEWVGAHGYRPIGQPWECYLDEPDVPQPRTEVFVPCIASDSAE